MEVPWFVLILLWTFISFQQIVMSHPSRVEFVDYPVEKVKSAFSPANAESIPMKRIAGTNLFSGVYYRVAKKTPQGGIFTYFDKAIKGAHRLQVDSDAARAYRYEEGNDWFGTDQWMFKEAPEFPGWYELHNNHFPEGVTAVSSTQVGGGYHIIVTERNEARFDVEGSQRDYALWKPVGVNDKYFQLKNKQYPEGIVTNSTTGFYSKLFYIQIDINPNNAASYEEGGSNFDETLFSAMNPNFVLNAKIENFKFPEITPDISPYKLTSTKKIDYDSVTVTGNKTSYKISQVYFDTNSLACAVEGKFGDFNRTTVKIDVPAIGGLSARSEAERPLSADGTLTGTVTNEDKVTMDIEVSTGRFVHLAVYTEWYENLPSHFDATMKITGSLRDGTILSSDFISSNLPVDWRNSQGGAENENTWQINVKGKLLLNFGYQREILTRLSVLPKLE